MDEIRQWLADESGSFDEGYAIFIKHTKNRHLVQYLGRKQDMQKLRYELGKFIPKTDREDIIFPTAVVIVDNEPEKPNDRLKIIREGGVKYEELPQEIKVIYQEAVEIYREMRSVHEKLKISPTDRDRAILRNKLLNLDDQRKGKWIIIDKWAQTGEIPKYPDNEIKDTGYKSVQAARTAVTRYIKELDANPDMDALKRTELIEKTRQAVAVVIAAGGKFDKLLDSLKNYGILSQ